MALALNKDGLKIFVFSIFFIILSYKQVLINITGFHRHVFGAVSFVLYLSALIFVLLSSLSQAGGRKTWGNLPVYLYAFFLGYSICHVAFTVIFLDSDAFGVVVRFMYVGLAPGLALCYRFLDRRFAIRAVDAMILMSTPVFVIAWMQFFVGVDSLPAILQADDRYFVGTNIYGYSRVNGLVGNHIEYNFYSLVILWMCLYRAKVARHWRYTWISIFVLVSIFLSSSRLGIAVSSAFLMYWYLFRAAGWRVWFFFVFVVFSGSVLIFLYFEQLWVYIYGLFDLSDNWSAASSTETHVVEIFSALESFYLNPLLGKGFGFQAGMENKIITDGAFWIVLIESGILFLLVYSLYVASFFQKTINMDLFSYIFIFHVIQFVNSSVFNDAGAFVFFVGLGLLRVLCFEGEVRECRA